MFQQQQAELLDRIAAGMCIYGICGNAGQHRVEATWVIRAGSVIAAIRHGIDHAVTLSGLICDRHHKRHD